MVGININMICYLTQRTKIPEGMSAFSNLPDITLYIRYQNYNPMELDPIMKRFSEQSYFFPQRVPDSLYMQDKNYGRFNSFHRIDFWWISMAPVNNRLVYVFYQTLKFYRNC